MVVQRIIQPGLRVFPLMAIALFATAQTFGTPSKNQSKTAKPSSAVHGEFSQQSSSRHKTVLLSRDSLSRIKAVLVVGPSSGSTKEDIEEITKIAGYLREKGVKVTELYDPVATWKNVVTASQGAHIFLYSGHGTYLGENGTSGGLCLSGDQRVRSSTIAKELLLHKNALVIFKSVCLGAGSSASDNSDIGINTAIQRVSDYAHPFIKQGALGYYANNFNNSIIPFLEAFFNRKNMKDAFQGTTGNFCKVEKTDSYRYKDEFLVSVASSEKSGLLTKISTIDGVTTERQVPGFKKYNIAFVGFPGFTVLDFFKK